MTIKRRLITIQLSIAASVLLLTTAVFVYNEIQQFRTALVSSATSTALLIGENSISTLRFFDARAAEQVLATLRVETHVTHAAIYDQDGFLFAHYRRAGAPDYAIPPERPDVGHLFVHDHLELVEPIESEGEIYGAVLIRVDLKQIDDKIEGFLEQVVLILLPVVLVTIVLALILQRKISQPILDLVAATRRVSETGDYSQRVQKQREDELGTLSAEFNQMLGLIQKRDASLLEAQESLEQRVEERTRELHQAVEVSEAASRSKTSFLANISHEFRTPLNAISGFAEILSSSLTNSKQTSHVREIQASCQSLLVLVGRILDFAKSESEELTLTPSEVAIFEVFETLHSRHKKRAENKAVGLEIDLDPGMPSKLHLDQDRFAQILDSLVDNAIKFTAQGRICVSVRTAPSDSDEGTVDLSFDIQDSGVGIPEDQVEEIFKAFTQAAGQSINEYGGTGMGLTMTRKLIEAMGGSIAVTSQVGVGSTFRVSLPGVRVAGSQTIGDLLDEMVFLADKRESGDADKSSWSSDELDASQRARLPELANTLSGKEDLVASMKDTLTINEIESFADEIRCLGEDYGVPPLNDWAKELAAAVEAFDMDQVEKNLEGYRALVESISLT